MLLNGEKYCIFAPINQKMASNARTKKKSHDHQKHGIVFRIFRGIFRSIMGMLTLAVCLLLVCAAYSGVINPTLTVLPAFLGLAFGPILIISLVWALVTVLLRRWHCVMVMIIALFATSVSALRYCPLHLFGGPTPKLCDSAGEPLSTIDTLQIFSYNTEQMGHVHLDKLKERIDVIDVAHDSGADIVCMQEYYFSANKGHTEEEIRQEMRDIYPYYNFLSYSYNKHMGIAIFSKYPIRKAERIDKQGKNYFAAMYYQIERHGQRIGIVNMHLKSNQIEMKDRVLYDEMIDHFEADSLHRIRTGLLRSLANGFRLRSAEAISIREYLLANHPKEMPLIVCGDMNDTPGSFCQRALCQVGLSDTWAEVGFGPGTTYREHHFWFCIDHFLHNDRVQALQMQVCTDVLHSDHYPIEATFQILPQ